MNNFDGLPPLSRSTLLPPMGLAILVLGLAVFIGGPRLTTALGARPAPCSVLGLAVFIRGHALPMARGARTALVARLGEVPYKIVYSLVAILAIALIAWGYGQYRATGWVQIWNPPSFMRHVTVALMWPSIVAIAAAYSPGHIKT